MVSGVMYDVDSYAEYLPQFLSSGCFPPIILDPNVLALRNFLWNPAAIRDCGALLSGCDINDSTLCDLVRWLVEEEVPCCQFMISTDEIVSFDSPESATSVGYRTGRESNGWILVPFDMMCKRTWKRTARWWGVWRPVWRPDVRIGQSFPQNQSWRCETAEIWLFSQLLLWCRTKPSS